MNYNYCYCCSKNGLDTEASYYMRDLSNNNDFYICGRCLSELIHEMIGNETS